MTTQAEPAETSPSPPSDHPSAGDSLKEKIAVTHEEEAALPVGPTEDAVDEGEEDRPGRFSLFHNMTVMPWPYMIIWPVILIFLIGFGWSQDDIIEDEVAKIWIPTSGAYAQDVEYATSLEQGELGASSFAAMSIARDGGKPVSGIAFRRDSSTHGNYGENNSTSHVQLRVESPQFVYSW